MKFLTLFNFILVPMIFLMYGHILYADEVAATRDRMLIWSRQLGVTCNHCHDQNNFLSEKKPAYKVAVKHSKMVKVLADDIFNNRDKSGNLIVEANCYMCHRGNIQPDVKEPLSPLNRKKTVPITNSTAPTEDFKDTQKETAKNEKDSGKK